MPFKNPHPLYQVWRSMRDRCRNPNLNQWADYGGRGIKICDRWDSFPAFVQDMGPRPDGYTLDRIDNDGDYRPGNCRWASRREQQMNQRRARYVVVEGARYRLADLAERSGMDRNTVADRAKRGLGMADVLSNQKFLDTSGLALGGRASGEKRRQRTHCPHGHEFTPENTRITPQGWRSCRKCHAAKTKRQWLAKRGMVCSGS